VDFVTKPRTDVVDGTVPQADEIVKKRSDQPKTPLAAPTLLKTTHQVIALGVSTGGTEALREVLEPLPADTPGIV
jgi:two-component system chemotaxis response regulator CheB